MKYPHSIRTHRSMIKRYIEKTEISSVFDQLFIFINQLIGSVQNGENINGKYQEFYKHYYIEMDIDEESINIVIRDTSVINRNNRQFFILSFEYNRKTTKVEKARFEIPYISVWSWFTFYTIPLHSFDEGRTLLQLVGQLSNTSKQIKKMSVSNPSNSEKDKMLKQINNYVKQAENLFYQQPHFYPFHQLSASLTHVAEKLDEIKNVEERHRIHSMVFIELNNIFILLEKLQLQHKPIDTGPFVDIFNGMNEFVCSCEGDTYDITNRELEKQIKILKERYTEKQVHI